MGSSGPLERRLRSTRYEKGAAACAQVLDSLGVPEAHRRLLDLLELEEIWPRYISRLREREDGHSRWPADQRAEVRRRVDELRDAASGMRVVWLALVDSEPVGVEVPGDALLGAGVDYLVSRAGDLMLTTRDLSHGVCIELNHLATGDEYEIAGWGVFSP